MPAQPRWCFAGAAPLLVAALLLLLASAARPAAACTSYIVGRHASEGVTVIARNDDGDGATSPTSLVYHPRRQHPAAFHANVNGFSITLPAPGLAYFALPDGPLADASSGRNTSGEAAGWNEAGVAISATESIYNSAAALAAGARACGCSSRVGRRVLQRFLCACQLHPLRRHVWSHPAHLLQTRTMRKMAWWRT